MTPHPSPATSSPTNTKARVYDWDPTDTRFPPGWHIHGDVEGWIPAILRRLLPARARRGGPA